mgnify:FL=1
MVQNINEIIPKIAIIAEFEHKDEIINLSTYYKKSKHNKSEQIQEKLNKNFN